MRELGDRACAGAQLRMRPDCALQSTAAWGIYGLVPRPLLYLLEDQGIYMA